VDLSDKRTVLTPRGFEELQQELNEILRVKRPAVVARISEARELGDLSENFDYHDAKQVQGMLEARVRDLKAILNSATVIDCPDPDGSIGIGSKVTLKDLEGGYEDEYMLVGPAESDPSEGKISHESCVGKVLIGRKSGDKVTVETPGGQVSYEIICVEHVG
jgi:transcription elongation factor GreA